MAIKISKDKRKIRVNITVDREELEKARKKLSLFGGKLSTLFNAYLSDFVESMEKKPAETHREILDKIKELEDKIKDLEKRRK